MTLYQLPNGDWIDPSRVTYLAYFVPGDPSLGHRVRIDMDGKILDALQFGTEADAKAFRDALAAARV